MQPCTPAHPYSQLTPWRFPLIFHAAQRSVGSDILLARHGSAISSMRLDRGRGQVVAFLSDGSFDMAPNLIDPSLHMPGRPDDDVKIIATVCAATAVLFAALVLATGLVIALAGPTQAAAFAASVATFPSL